MPLRQPSDGSNRQKKKTKLKTRFDLRRDMEPLEPRALLTTFVGGDTFEFQDIGGQIDRITFTGNITAEVIGASIDRNTNAISLTDLPGVLYTGGQGINGIPQLLNGGITTPQGASVIGTITIIDPFDANGNGNGNIGGLASDAAGNLYGINVVIPQNTGGTTGTTAPNLLQIVR